VPIDTSLRRIFLTLTSGAPANGTSVPTPHMTHMTQRIN
jgi:hypothetical protein